MEKYVNLERLAEVCSKSENRKIAWKKYLRSKKVDPISYSTFCRCVKKNNIDTSHFIKKGHKWTEYDYIVHNHSIGKRQNTTSTKKLLKFFGNKCQGCGADFPLEIHHVDCNRENTKIDNLACLCSNCHSMVHRSIIIN